MFKIWVTMNANTFYVFIESLLDVHLKQLSAVPVVVGDVPTGELRFSIALSLDFKKSLDAFMENLYLP